MVDSYPTSTHFEAKISYDDSSLFGGKFALNPYVAYWQELDEKATVVFNTATSDSTYYFTLGINVFKLPAVNRPPQPPGNGRYAWALLDWRRHIRR